jgi:hypothetical protein
MSMKSRIRRLEKKTLADEDIVFIDAKSREDFEAQIRERVQAGLDPEGKKFVYTENPIARLIKEIQSRPLTLPRDPCGT